MKARIRLIEPKDVDITLQILRDAGFSSMEKSDVEYDTLVAELDGRVVGCIWCLIGRSTTGYIGYFAVQNLPEVKKSHAASLLMFDALLYLRKKGCTKIIGILMGNEQHRMANAYTRIGGVDIIGRFTVIYNGNIDKSIKGMVQYFHYLKTGKSLDLDRILLEPINKTEVT